MSDLFHYLKSSEFAADLSLIQQTAAAELSPHDDAETLSEVGDAVQHVLESLFGSAAANSYRVPSLFWQGDLGQAMAAARLLTTGDTLITITAAAAMLGKAGKSGLMYVRALVRDGRLTGYRDATEPNPTRAARVSREEVQSLASET